MMEIRLEYGIWHINGYIIEGTQDLGYNIYLEDDSVGSMPLFTSDDFEVCLTWCYNS